MQTTIRLFLASAVIFFSISCSSQVIKGTYAIKNAETGMVLRIKDASNKNGTPLVSYTPVNWKCVTWDFQHIEGETYQLKNLFTGKTFQPINKKITSGTAMEQQPIEANLTEQEYEFIPVEKNSYLIKLKNSDLYLMPSDHKGSVNSAIILAEKTGTKLQQWTIYEQHPKI